MRPEIWAYGVRNPWRMSFDAETGRLWLGDVGQSRFEEIDIVERGANLGWNLVEGGSCFQGDCDLANFAAPVAVYDHDLGCSVTGGVVVRRSGLSYLDGAYVYGDFCSGRIWTIDADPPGEPSEILTSPAADFVLRRSERRHRLRPHVWWRDSALRRRGVARAAPCSRERQRRNDNIVQSPPNSARPRGTQTARGVLI